MKFEHFKKLVDSMFMPDGNGGVRQHYDQVEPRELNPLVLAYIGDAYFHLFVRGRLLSYEQNKVRVLHQFSAQIVSAVWQCRAYHAIEDRLTEEERSVYKRARNADSHAPRKATVAEYHASTGFEALLGYLYLQEDNERLYEVAEMSFQAISQAMMKAIASKGK
jgi:ribonuclease-3 family protein